MGAIAVGRVAGHRGAHGELTVRGCPQASDWSELPRVWIGTGAEGRSYDVETSRGYRDRLVLKLEGIDDPSAAERLRGETVRVARADAPRLPEGVHYVAELVGCEVHDETAGRLGRVEDVVATGGTDVIRVGSGPSDDPTGKEAEDEELLIPLAGVYVVSIDPAARRIVVRLPRELRELNRTNRAQRRRR